MARVSKIICDRCRKELNYGGKTARIRRQKPRIFKITYLWNGNPSGYDYTEEYLELCADCTKKLEEFICNKGEENGNQ